jgi:hypothetical protein
MSSPKVLVSPTYKIHRWDAVQFSTIKKFPIIYITPDLAFLDFVRNNNYQVVAHISGTHKIYDHMKMQGTVDKSGSVPNCRPNYFEQNGYYVITLDALWDGYPALEHLGEVSFLGLSVNKYDEKYLAPTPNEHDIPQIPPKRPIQPDLSTNTTKKGLSGTQIAIVSSILVAALVALFAIYFVRKK